MKRWAAPLAVFIAAGCARSPATPTATASSCDARVRIVSERPLVLDVELHCSGRPLSGFVATEPASLPAIAVGSGVVRRGSRFSAEFAGSESTLGYRIDLDAVAARAQNFDVALRSGSSLVAPVSTWLLRPDPLRSDVPVRLRVETPPGVRFETGLAKQGAGYALASHEIPVATYAVFGRFESRALSVDDSRIDLSFADGRIAAGRDTLARWVSESAQAVGKFWRRFPVPRVHITIIPVAGREGVLFGKVLPESSPGVALLVGENTTRERLYQDWILIHELFHLGVPSFSGEGKWFDEGLATYFEPIIRARAGWRSEASVWREFQREMPRGLVAVEQRGVERVDDFSGVYWGGAIVVMLADLEIRRRSAGARGLEDGLHGVLDAGGHASVVWPLARALELCDRSAGETVLGPLAQKHARGGRRVDLEALWRELGVRATGDGVQLVNDAPLSAVRRAVLRGGAHSTSSKLGRFPKLKPIPAM
jgi:hypothetical protein